MGGTVPVASPHLLGNRLLTLACVRLAERMSKVQSPKSCIKFGTRGCIMPDPLWKSLNMAAQVGLDEALARGALLRPRWAHSRKGGKSFASVRLRSLGERLSKVQGQKSRVVHRIRNTRLHNAGPAMEIAEHGSASGFGRGTCTWRVAAPKMGALRGRREIVRLRSLQLAWLDNVQSPMSKVKSWKTSNTEHRMQRRRKMLWHRYIRDEGGQKA